MSLRTDTSNRRERILEETLRIVGQRGYHGFGLAELAERCGLTKAGLLHHFGSKEQLLIAVLDSWEAKETAELSRLFMPAYAGHSVAEQRQAFRDAMHTMMARAQSQPELMRLHVVLRAEAVNPEHPANAFFLAHERANRLRIVERISPIYPQAEALARSLMAVMAGLQEQWLREAEGFGLLAAWDHALSQLLPTAPD